jgi:hypothetical protein
MPEVRRAVRRRLELRVRPLHPKRDSATLLRLNDVDKQTDLISRLQDEADLCRNDGADDIAALLDEAVEALRAELRYEADDGKQFRSEAQRAEYEQQCVDLAVANDMLDNGATLMAALTRANKSRPWWDCSLTRQERDLLAKLNRHTKLAMPHWQCCPFPEYPIRRIGADGRVWVGEYVGEPGYGNFVGLKDLLRYASQTAAQHA